MKAKVLINFWDKVAKVQHKKGDIIEVTPTRFNEICLKGRYIEVYVESAKEAESKK